VNPSSDTPESNSGQSGGWPAVAVSRPNSEKSTGSMKPRPSAMRFACWWKYCQSPNPLTSGAMT
jgi:hypothetical protein